MTAADDAPIILIALDQPVEGAISARREGEPSFTGVADLGDAVLCALNRGVDLIVPAEMYAEIRDELPPELPPYIKIAGG
jgi:hypothetical protein